ncbi:MAG TPA: type II toxin-antitoxin system VapC family toxin [Luteolibacter sp.]|nr:type II toxin-antitoxin system VapC family toxin [Luteolibacter sp.]
MKLLDVNILVQVHREDADRHTEVKAWLEEAMAEPTGVAVSELVLSGFLRIVTHPKVFIQPTPLDLALEFVEDIRDRDTVHILSPGTRHWRIFSDLCRKADARGNLIPDAYHAALAIETGCEWITMDRGFSRYPGLRWRHPLDPP